MTTALPFDDRYVSITATAGQTVLAWDFELTREDGIEILKIAAADGARTTLTFDNGDFSFPSGLGDASGGTLTLAVAAAAGDIFRLYGLHPEDKLSDFSATGKFDTAKINAQVDALTIIAQEHRRDIGRSWKSEFGAAGRQVAVIAEGHFHKADADGNLVDGGSAADIAGAEANAAIATAKAAAALASALAAAASAASITLKTVALASGLAALTPANAAFAFVQEEAHQSAWLWDGGDHSAAITATDPRYKALTDEDGSAGAYVLAGSVPTGSFATDQATPARVHRLADRVFIGVMAGAPGTYSALGVGPGGLSDEAQTLHPWIAREATLLVGATQGKYAIVGHAQASDQTAPPHGIYTGTIGVAGTAINDSTALAAWGGYFEAYKFAAAGFTVGLEAEVANLSGTTTSLNPFNAKSGGAGAGVGLWVASGAGLDAVSYDNSLGTVIDAAAGIVILSSFADNSVKFGRGIAIANGALTDTGAGTFIYRAFDMPERHQIGWWRDESGTGTLAAFIWADAIADGSASVGMTFKQNLIDFTGSSGIRADAARIGGATNYATISRATGVNDALTISNAGTGLLTFKHNGTDVFYGSAGGLAIASGKAIFNAGVQVLAARVTGFTTIAGTANKNGGGINAGTITATDSDVRALAAFTKALADAAITHGWIGA